jgi:hypothetical protein
VTVDPQEERSGSSASPTVGQHAPTACPRRGFQAGRQGRVTAAHPPHGGAWSARRCSRRAAYRHRRTRLRDTANGSRARRMGAVRRRTGPRTHRSGRGAPDGHCSSPGALPDGPPLFPLTSRARARADGRRRVGSDPRSRGTDVGCAADAPLGSGTLGDGRAGHPAGEPTEPRT